MSITHSARLGVYKLIMAGVFGTVLLLSASFAFAADTTKPTITLNEPAFDSCALASGFKIRATVTDNVGIGSVYLWLFDHGVAKYTVSAYRMTLNVATGQYEAPVLSGVISAGNDAYIYLKARDTSLNESYIAGDVHVKTLCPSITPVPAPSITVIAPNRSEQWVLNTPQTISWSWNQPGSSIQDISLVDPTTGVLSASIQNGFVNSTVGQTNLPFTFSNILTGSYKVKVCDRTTGVCDTSDAPFSIVEAPVMQPEIQTISLSPASPAAGSLATISWSAKNVDKVRIGYSKSSDTSYANLTWIVTNHAVIKTTSFSPQAYPWIVPSTLSGQTVRVEVTGYNGVASGAVVTSPSFVIAPATTLSYRLSTILDGAGNGKIESVDASGVPVSGGILCNINNSDPTVDGPSCIRTYSAGTVVELKATPSAGSTFAGWTGACNVISLFLNCRVDMTGAKLARALFNPIAAPPTTLQAPTNVTATVFNLGDVALAWNDNNSGTITFVIEGNVDGGTYTRLSGADYLLKSFNDARSIVTSGHTYGYKVYACANSICSIPAMVTVSMRPDLIIQNLSASAQSSPVNTPITFSALIGNRGPVSAELSNTINPPYYIGASFFVNKDNVVQHTMSYVGMLSRIPNGGNGSVSTVGQQSIWTPTVPGIYTVTACAVVHQTNPLMVPEGDLSNNCTKNTSDTNVPSGFAKDYTITITAPTIMPTITNVSQGKRATQSSTIGDITTLYASLRPYAVASKGVDGNTSGQWVSSSANGVFHTDRDGVNYPWWQVDLGAIYEIDHVELFNRTDCCSPERANLLTILVSSDADDRFSKADSEYARVVETGFGAYGVTIISLAPASFARPAGASGPLTGRYVRVRLNRIDAQAFLHLAEVKVFGTLRVAGSVKTSSVFTASALSALQTQLNALWELLRQIQNSQ